MDEKNKNSHHEEVYYEIIFYNNNDERFLKYYHTDRYEAAQEFAKVVFNANENLTKATFTRITKTIDVKISTYHTGVTLFNNK